MNTKQSPSVDVPAHRDPSKAPSIVCTQTEDFLRVTISGQRGSTEELIEVWRSIAGQVRDRGAKRVMIVSELVGPIPSPEDQRRVMRATAGHGFEGVRTAFVLTDTANVTAMEHGELEARELGQDSRVFGSQELARVWLCYGE